MPAYFSYIVLVLSQMMVDSYVCFDFQAGITVSEWVSADYR